MRYGHASGVINSEHRTSGGVVTQILVIGPEGGPQCHKKIKFSGLGLDALGDSSERSDKALGDSEK
jgi:hypothetical protein